VKHKTAGAKAEVAAPAKKVAAPAAAKAAAGRKPPTVREAVTPEKADEDIAKERIGKEGLNIAKVIPLSKLKKDYFGFEAKRKLRGAYDIFLAYDRILGELPKLLGKMFSKKKKPPIPVNLT
jgi:hypothetical protein